MKSEAEHTGGFQTSIMGYVRPSLYPTWMPDEAVTEALRVRRESMESDFTFWKEEFGHTHKEWMLSPYGGMKFFGPFVYGLHYQPPIDTTKEN